MVMFRLIGATGPWKIKNSADLEHWAKVANLEKHHGIIECMENIHAGRGPCFYSSVKL
jgi:hypothetical protein